MKFKPVILAALGLVLVAGAANAGNAQRSKADYVQSCAILVNHKHPGLKGDAWKAEWNKCNNDRVAYRDSK
ncbi:MAG: hypothetical protein ACLQE9_14075 [Roseiarcus sp.]